MNHYKGRLEYYTEQGEMLAAIANIEHPSDNFWDKIFSFDKRTKAQVIIKHPKTQEIVFEGEWIYSREATQLNGYFPSPKGIQPALWREWCLKGFFVEITTEELIKADRSSIDISFSVDIWRGDLLVGLEAKIFKVVTGERVEVMKARQKWFSEGVVKNFSYAEQELKIFTDKEIIIVKKAVTPLLTSG